MSRLLLLYCMYLIHIIGLRISGNLHKTPYHVLQYPDPASLHADQLEFQFTFLITYKIINAVTKQNIALAKTP